MTRLDQLDAYALTFGAPVVATRVVDDDPRQAWVRLAASAFYPTSGGQPHDLGRLDGVDVIDVAIDESGVWHRVAAPVGTWPVGQLARGEVDGQRRARHRQRHSAQHLLSQAFVRTDPAFATRAVSLASADCTVDLAGEPDEKAIAAAERLANEAAYAGWPVVATEVDEAELGRYPLRRPPKVTGRVRLVAMGPDVHDDPASAWELSACGGTHVRNTAEVAPITVLRSERVRGGLTRITFRAGWEAWEDHRYKHAVASHTAASLSTGVPELGAKVTALADEATDLRRALAETRALLAEHLADDLLGDDPAPGALLVAELDEREAELLAPLADALAGRGATAALAVARGGKAEIVLASGSGVDVRPALAAALVHLSGRGGGRPERAQGAGPATDGVAAALAAAHDVLAG
ncbi:MAG: DHHA1 domain-containing protein [Trueperaceae bacterium]